MSRMSHFIDVYLSTANQLLVKWVFRSKESQVVWVTTRALEIVS